MKVAVVLTGVPFGEEFSEARRTIRFISSAGEFLPCQRRSAMSASEAFPVPSLILERDTPGRHNLHQTDGSEQLADFDHLFALCASCGELLLEALHAVNVGVVWNDEWSGAHGDLESISFATFAWEKSKNYLAHCTFEAFVVPFPVLVFHLLRARSE